MTTHGKTHSRLYKIWKTMKQRVSNPNTINYSLYGGKGVSVCDEWSRSFEAFFTWAILNGYEADLSIDRVDSNGNYCPENCRWVNMKIQQNNRSNNHIITFNGESLTLSMWAERIGLNPKTLSRRIVDKGWSIERALTTPLQTNKSHKRGALI